MNGNNHIPVLLEEVLDFLDIKREGIYIDCTIGLGGHALEILKRNPNVTLIGFDIDEKSLLEAKKKLQPYENRVELYHSDFRYLPDLKMDFSHIRGILLDLGVSSFQLDSPERGFSFNHEGPLDMRMDLRNKITALKIINKYSEHKLADLFREYGELRQSKRLAREIISHRRAKKIETTTQLLHIVEKICRWRPQKGKTHPAAKVFQALRIEVNQELRSLSGFLERISQKIPKKGRIIAISFHSLEDRIIKHTFRQLAVSENSHSFLKILTKKPIIPSEEEVASNFRARSAKLRAVERV
ncbi:MAG: 16S rRNA (cytosine(1402)-N(4))-methyltransferase RsmH [Candidatus Aminicenantes bacterium]|nr:MAG: 16S rRNA (cytosine(1402)-N(4))-methyltransferase RsmH [Candidatus Aminicenantes bacterium]